jgi:hypothetical protein
MKANDVEVVQEGPIGDFFKSVQDWAQVRNARITQVANTINKETKGLIRSAISSVADMEPAQYPIQRMMQGAFAAGSRLVAREQIAAGEISTANLIAYYRTNNRQIISNLRSKLSGASDAQAMGAEMLKFANRQPATPLDSDFETQMQAISLLVAGTLMDWEFNQVTDNATAEFDETELEGFEQASKQLTEMLFQKNNEVLTTLSFNDQMKTNLENLLVDITEKVEATSKMANLNPNYNVRRIVDPNRVKQALTNHLDQGSRTPEMIAKINEYSQKVTEAFDETVKQWITLAALERSKTNNQQSGNAFITWTEWGKEAIKDLDQNQEPQQAAPADTDNAFGDPQGLQAAWQQFVNSGQAVTPELKSTLADIASKARTA